MTFEISWHFMVRMMRRWWEKQHVENWEAWKAVSLGQIGPETECVGTSLSQRRIVFEPYLYCIWTVFVLYLYCICAVFVLHLCCICTAVEYRETEWAKHCTAHCEANVVPAPSLSIWMQFVTCTKANCDSTLHNQNCSFSTAFCIFTFDICSFQLCVFLYF